MFLLFSILHMSMTRCVPAHHLQRAPEGFILAFSPNRLDAGTFGTMGVGLGFAIAAAILAKARNTGQRVICVEGDSAFGFSGMEVETICRYNSIHFFLQKIKNKDSLA